MSAPRFQFDLLGFMIAEAQVLEKPKRKTHPGGYAAPPGSGPKGETCKSCDHYCRVGGHAKAYRKCGLVRARWTNGPGTDILARSPACAAWKKAND